MEQRDETGQDSEIWTKGNGEASQAGRRQVLFQLWTFKNNVALRTGGEKPRNINSKLSFSPFRYAEARFNFM